ncbi:MAG TPA: radical SAM protein [Draconibacterium sp.]|nr:radical SAM protein [Draconibacterium sp.]
MKYIQIRGERKKIPGYPHHKEFVYKCYRFFNVKSLFNFLTIDGLFYIPKKIYKNWIYNCTIPRLLLVDPTSACNLKCKGCWACDYKKNTNLSFEKLDEIFTDAQKMGVTTIIMSGGEPLMRKDDILKLSRKHRKISFGMFTNGLLIDETFAGEMVKLGNLNVFISIEGYREENDFRRGEGTYDKVIEVMEMLRKKDIGFGFSICYHSKNYELVSSEEFLDFLVEKGAWFGWMFNYLPIGSDADISLCCSAAQRAFVKQRIEEYNKKNNFIAIDFANSGHKAIGCVAAGNDFAHINSNGDLEPCAFCHYSDSNINEMSLAQALRSPFFQKFRNSKPFSNNYYRPCPLVDVPEAIVKLTSSPSVNSTHLKHTETAEQLAVKTSQLAKTWKPVAEELYKNAPKTDKRRYRILSSLVNAGNKFNANKW